MALKNIVGLDHVVHVVRDLDAAADAWRCLGFTLSPRGTHSPQMGTGNYTIMFRDDYIELLGVLQDTQLNAPTRAFAARHGEGIERVAFTALDAAAGVEEIKSRGIAGTGPIDFGRPVALPNGGQTQARFRVFLWPVEEAPAGVRIFACQHLTREAVWIPELQKHANTARRLSRLEILSPDPQGDAEHLARLIDGEIEPGPEGAFLVPSGGSRADFVFLSRHALARRHPGAAVAGLPESGAVVLVLAVNDLDAAARATSPHGAQQGEAVYVPPSVANGLCLCFIEA